MVRVKQRRRILLLFALTDLVILWAALSLVTVSRLDGLTQIDFLLIRRDRLVCLFLFLVAASMAGAHRPSRINDRFDSMYYSVLALVCAGMASLVLVSVVPADLRAISRREIILGTAVGSVFLAVWRFLAAGWATRFRCLHRQFYVLGNREKGERIAREILENGSPVHSGARYMKLDDLRRELELQKAACNGAYFPNEDAIVALEPEERNQLEELVTFCRESCYRTFLYPNLHDMVLLPRQNLYAVAGIPLIQVASRQIATPYTYIKRLMDIVASSVGLLLAAPICLVTAVAVKATSPGGVLYSQERVGQNGRPFKIYKFRSMTADVEIKDETGHVLASAGDPRITPVGRFIRKHRIDEIPQLYNVLKGDMSLIGPRPVWREYYDTNRETIPLIEQRLAVRPGLTCLSHVLGSYFSTPGDRLCYDLVYISTLSFMTDLRIMLATVRIVLSGKGAQ